MKNNLYIYAWAAALSTAGLLTSCDESSDLLPDTPDTPQAGETISRYVVAAQSGGSSTTAMSGRRHPHHRGQRTGDGERLEPHLL